MADFHNFIKAFFFCLTRYFKCSPERSYCVCGPSAKGIGNDAVYDVRSSFGVQVVQVFFFFFEC
jgi:hypothetical protein